MLEINIDRVDLFFLDFYTHNKTRRHWLEGGEEDLEIFNIQLGVIQLASSSPTHTQHGAGCW